MTQRVAKVTGILTAAAVLWLVCLQARVQAAGSGNEGKDSGQSLAIVVNQSNPVNDLSTQELRKIFLGERSHWANGNRITLVMMQSGQPERSAVLHQIFHMSESEFSRHFLHGLFTGQVFVSPKTLAGPTGVCKFVFNVPGAIGYVRASDVSGAVKAIRIDGRMPDDKGYSLRLEGIPQS